jgi:hypothetical protein
VTHHLLFQTTCHLLWFFFKKGPTICCPSLIGIHRSSSAWALVSRSKRV